jgi:hypothetical protein
MRKSCFLRIVQVFGWSRFIDSRIITWHETGAVKSIWIGTAVSTDAAAGTWSGHAQITRSCTSAGKAVGAWKCTAADACAMESLYYLTSTRQYKWMRYLVYMYIVL